MWIGFVIASLFAGSAEAVIDKIAVVKNKAIDMIAATYWRQVFFLFWFAVIAATGLVGPLQLLLSWPIFLVAVLGFAGAVSYTYILKHVEITAESAIAYAAPAVFLIVDVFVVHTHLTVFQVCGIFLLMFGGFIFTIDPHKFHFRKEFTPIIWGIFALDTAIAGVEYYTFQYYHRAGVSETSFYFSAWFIMVVFFTLFILFSGRTRTVWQTARRHRYAWNVAVSKFFDAGASWLWLHALTLASVSQVNAVGALAPVVLLVTVYIFQDIFGFKAEEQFSKGRLGWKIAAVVLLCVGGWFAS